MSEPPHADDVRRLGVSFDLAAQEYERGRPGYPKQVIDWWSTRDAFARGNRVLDLAAGTGKLTRMLPRAGCKLIAVEPLENMRAEFERAVPDISVIDGTAEDIPFSDDSFDTVLVAQAFHWFDPATALDEIARVLRPGGGLGLVWNQDDVDAADWLEEIGQIKRSVSSSPLAAGMRAVADIAAHPWFDAADSTEIRWSEPTTFARIIANLESRSYVATMPDEERSALLSRVRAALRDLREDGGETTPLSHPHRTFAFWARCPL